MPSASPKSKAAPPSPLPAGTREPGGLAGTTAARPDWRCWRTNLREQADAIHTGFTLADWGIADTGTLVLDSSSEDVRLATMLCETHVAVLPRSRLRATPRTWKRS